VGSLVIAHFPSDREPSVSVSVMVAPAAQFLIVPANPFNQLVHGLVVR